MAGIARGIRFLIGLAMVAGGVTLAAPVALRLANLATTHFGGPGAAVQPAAPMPPAGVPPMQVPPPAPPTLSVGTGEPPPAPAAASTYPAAAAETAAVQPLDGDYRPPAPPTPLPTLPAEFVMPGPQVANAYRSTLEVPPPPLLDSQQPPPLAVAWSAHSVATQAPARVQPTADVPQTYRIKDGDDLTSIATRFYGHPGAAAAIWEANRGTISDPTLLPIDAELRLPAAWTVGSMPTAGTTGRAIEPPPMTAGAATGPRAASVSWLGIGGAVAAPPPPTAPPPRQVRVAPGETLATIAQRFYGDAAQADRIWEANRDQLRSPELVVAGMELRLP